MCQSNMIKATVGILTFNSEKYLNRCLNSVKKFNEILIIDGGSKDDTLKIAKKFKCKIKQQPKQFKFNNNKIRDFSKLRKYILKLSKNELVLFLDSDEFLKRTALKKIDFYSKSQTSKKKYYSFLLGRFPMHKNKIITQKTIFYPNYQERLFYKSNIKTFVKPVHERVIPNNKYLTKKKIEDASIIFPLDINYQRLYDKCKYYFEIEKTMISRKNFLNSLNFVFHRFLIILKYIFTGLFFKSKKLDKDYKDFENKLIKIHIFFSFKLLLKAFS